MSQSTNSNDVTLMCSLPELGTLLLKEKNIHDGLYEVSVEFQVAVGAVGPDDKSVLPGAVIGVKRIGLRKVEEKNPLTIDAAVVNPKKTTAKRSSNASQSK